MRFRIAQYAHIPEVSEMVKYSLEELGHPTTIEVGNNITKKPYDYTIVIRALKSVMPHTPEPKILFQTEQLWNRRAKGYYDVGNGFVRVLEMFEENVKIPGGTKNVKHCPIGYTPTYSMGLSEPEKKDIDVFFFGSLTPKRKEICNRLFAKFKNERMVFKEGIWGEEREKIIMRSKIILNMKAHDKWAFGPIHTLPAIANKRFVLAEKGDGGYSFFKPNKHFQQFNGLNDLFEKVEYWLRNDEEREKFAENAFELAKKEGDFTPILKKAMEGII